MLNCIVALTSLLLLIFLICSLFHSTKSALINTLYKFTVLRVFRVNYRRVLRFVMEITVGFTDGMLLSDNLVRGAKQVVPSILFYLTWGEVQRVVLRLRVNRIANSMINWLVQYHIVMFSWLLVQATEGITGLEVWASLPYRSIRVQIPIVVNAVVRLTRVCLDVLANVISEVGIHRPTAIIVLRYTSIWTKKLIQASDLQDISTFTYSIDSSYYTLICCCC